MVFVFNDDESPPLEVAFLIVLSNGIAVILGLGCESWVCTAPSVGRFALVCGKPLPPSGGFPMERRSSPRD